MYTSLVLYFSIFALSKERTWLSFHCWLYNLCIVVYVTNKTWNLKQHHPAEKQNKKTIDSITKFVVGLLFIMELVFVFNGNCIGPCGSLLVIDHLLVAC